MFIPLLPPRPANSHKGMFGRIGLVGGAPGTVGALLLAGRASLGCGAGLVTLGMLDDAVHVDFAAPELMFAPPESLVTDLDLSVLAIGPGLGQSRQAFDLMQAALLHPALLVIDADGLNLIARRGDLSYLCSHRSPHTLLTPHPGEAARLLEVSTRDVQANRELAARELAVRFNALVALKGAGTVLARPDGEIEVNKTGNPALSAPGMGDVLTGMMAALAARLVPWEALRQAVWLHGQAADDALQEIGGVEGLTATEMVGYVRRRLNACAA
jgi:hydroxyethylthiazole kinase-like uncharacterized protein yjeF